jgi:Sec-independent protein secretion pathway component TatC
MEWQLILALVIAIPIVLFVPMLVWAAVASGLYQVAKDAMRRRVIAPRRKATSMAEETISSEVTR